MILLDTVNKSIEVILDAGVVTQLPIVANWIDITVLLEAVSGVSDLTLVTNDTTAVAAIAAPASGVTRQVKYLSVNNPNTGSVTAFVRLNSSGSFRNFFSALLNQDESLVYIDGIGIQVLTANGEQKESLILINLTSQVTGVLPVANGGTGDATLTAHGVLVGEGVSPVAVTSPGTVGQVLTSNGASADPTFQNGVTTPVTVPNGGTGDTTLTNHGVLIGQATSAVAVTAAGTAGFALTSNGAAADPTYQLNLDNSIQDFRLTLTTGLPVTISDVTGATTLYCTPYKGNRIALYDGSAWNIRTSAEFSLALGTLTSGKNYDVFCYDNAGVPTLEFLVWTSDTARATALAYQDGVLVKSGAVTRRYLGTFYTTSTTQTEDSRAKRDLFNYYNRVRRSLLRKTGTASWTYSTDTWQQAAADAANQCECVIGVAEAPINAHVGVNVANSAGADVQVGIGIDSTSAPHADNIIIGKFMGGNIYDVHAWLDALPAAGRHTIVWLERSQAAGTTTWYGVHADNSGTPIPLGQSGINGFTEG